MNIEKLQQDLDTIEANILVITGFYSMLDAIGAFQGIYKQANLQEVDRLGETMKAVLEVKKELGLESKYTVINPSRKTPAFMHGDMSGVPYWA